MKWILFSIPWASAPVVLSGTAKFSVFVDIGDHFEENLVIAKQLAILVLKKC